MAVDQTTTAVVTKKLRKTINTIDCLSQNAFSDIQAITTMALAYIEATSNTGEWDEMGHTTLARALNIIRDRTHDAENCINVEAETVGCNYTGSHDEQLN